MKHLLLLCAILNVSSGLIFENPKVSFGRYRQLDIIPSVIPELPRENLQVTYPNNVAVDNGNWLTAHETMFPPRVEWVPLDDMTYCLLMLEVTDKSTTYANWIVVNVPEKFLARGQVLLAYEPPSQHPEHGLHKFAFILYQQPAPTFFDEYPNGMVREQFSLEDFAKKYEFQYVQAVNGFLVAAGQGRSSAARTTVRHTLTLLFASHFLYLYSKIYFV